MLAAAGARLSVDPRVGPAVRTLTFAERRDRGRVLAQVIELAEALPARPAREAPVPAILGPVELVLFRAFFDRTKDWADIEAVVEAQLVDAVAVRAALVEALGEGDRRVARLDEIVGAAG